MIYTKKITDIPVTLLKTISSDLWLLPLGDGEDSDALLWIRPN